MLMESAFLKIPELMVSNLNSGNVEALVVQYLANSLQMELNCRSVPFAYNHVTVESPYPKQDKTGAFYGPICFLKIAEVACPPTIDWINMVIKKNNGLR